MDLTRALYFKDEVIAMLLTSLLECRSLDECLFWFWELNSSTDIVDGLWVIYLLFYSTKDSSLERYMRAKIKQFQSSDDASHLLGIICNLRCTDPDPYAYVIHYYLTNHEQFPPNFVLPALPSRESDCNAYILPLLRSLHSGDPKLTGYYLNVAIRKLGEEEVRGAIINASPWTDSDTLTDIFPATDTCVLAALCARFIRQKPYPRSKFFMPVPKHKFIELIKLFRMKKGETPAQHLERIRIRKVSGYLPPASYTRAHTSNDEIIRLCAESMIPESELNRILNLKDPQFTVTKTPEDYLIKMGESRLACEVSSLNIS